ncbi:MAG: ribonuclease D [Alphaproteobacteria bacterium]
MTIITDTDTLNAACERLARHAFVTVDTEFMRETTFWPNLCLIQMASPEEAFIVDPLADGISLDPFFRLMANEQTTKVFHAARQDIEIVYHLGGLVPHPVFDTQVAAMVSGFGESISYDQLVGRVTGHQIDKSSRFTDWSKRPLSKRQIDYALADVTHLRDVYAMLAETLERKKRSEWVREEMEILTSPETYRQAPADAWRRLKMRVKKPLEFAVMREIAAWREEEAQTRNVPRNRVLKDDAIYELAAQQPESREELGRLRTIPRGFERSKIADHILAAIKRARTIPEGDLPRVPRNRGKANGTGAAVDLLKVLLKMTSENHGVATKVIATIDELEAIATDDEADVPALSGWRRDLFGENAIRLKHGHIALAVTKNNVVAIARPSKKGGPTPER